MNTLTKFTALAAILVLTACGEKEAAAPPPPPPKVEVTEVKAQTVPIVFEVAGTVQGTRQVAIKPRVSGTIEQVLFKEGSAVNKGDPLYQIDPRPFQAQLDAANAQLAVDQANLEFANAEVERYTKLAKQGAGSVERKEDTIKEQKQATAAIAKDKADIAQAELNLGYTHISAPFDGVVQATRVYQGAVVTAQQTSLTELVTLDPVYVLFSVSRSDAFRLQQLQEQGYAETDITKFTAAYNLSDGSRAKVRGHVDFRSTQLDPTTDTFRGRAIIENPVTGDGSAHDRNLIPGQYVPLFLTVGQRPDTLLIPQTALLQTQEGTHVWVVDDQNKTQRRVITIGPAYQDQWIVKKGLKAGDRVVSQGVQKIKKSGVEVQVADAAAAAPAATPAPAS